MSRRRWRLVAPLTPLLPVRQCWDEDDETGYRCTLRRNHNGDHEAWISARFMHRWRR